MSPLKQEYQDLLQPIHQFLLAPTPEAWITEASKPDNLPILLIDHCNCELKAAQTAVWLMRKYAVSKASGERLLSWVKPYEAFVYRKEGEGIHEQKQAEMEVALDVDEANPFGRDIVDKMLRLVKEELTHFEQVLGIIKTRSIPYSELSASRYAKGLIKHVRTFEPATLVDKLIIGAYIEARSCERFAALAPHLDDELNHFYCRLLKSEARHFRDYLKLAEMVAGENIDHRVAELGKVEADLILSDDQEFRFHSGSPA